MASPGHGLLRWLRVTLMVLEAEERVRQETGNTECVLDVIEGEVDLLRAGSLWHRAVRRSFFDDKATLMCIPPRATYELLARSPAIVLGIQAPVERAGTWGVVRAEDVPARVVGRSTWQRTVWPGTAELPVTQRLLVGETYNPPGNWSSYPPHKHDSIDPPRELPYEELYFFRFDPPGGFGLQRIYGEEQGNGRFDVVLTVEDGDAVIIPRGYHPVVAAPGYRMGYVWALCGQGKQYGAWTEDPAHSWVARGDDDAS